jgi:hypothetical protein
MINNKISSKISINIVVQNMTSRPILHILNYSIDSNFIVY